MIALIAAVANNGVIGNSGTMPWHLPADFLYFKETTMGHPVIMGSVTFESIGMPLPGRKNFVLSNTRGVYEGVEMVESLDEAIGLGKQENDLVFIIGGASVYAQAIERADRLYITEVDAVPEGDTHFPSIDMNRWREISRRHRAADDNNKYNMDFVVYERKE